jgi:hypothetical protein
LGEGQVWLEHAGFFTSYSKIDRENDDQLADLELDGFSRSKTYRDILAIFWVCQFQDRFRVILDQFGTHDS